MGVIVSLNMSVSGGECECEYDCGAIVSEDKISVFPSTR